MTRVDCSYGLLYDQIPIKIGLKLHMATVRSMMLYGTAFRITNLLERSCSCDHLVLADSLTHLIERPSAIRLMSCAFGALFSMLPDV